ncbi:MAG: hypothetical protein H8E86_01085 [Planctomycetes bacterium]|nr:hypothetical protein [Planctomycetota bacterium]
METLLSIANTAKLRMQFAMALRSCLHWFLLLACLLFVLAIIDRVGISAMMPWNVILILVGAVTVLTSLLVWNARAVTTLEAAASVDERLELHDRISSAIAEIPTTSPFSDAVLADALSIVEKEQVKSKLARAFPIQVPNAFGIVLAIACVTAVILWSPQWGFFQGSGGDGLPSAVVDSRENVTSSVEAVLEQLKEDEALSKELEEELEELAATTTNSLADPEQMRSDALKKMTDLQRRLDEMMKDENALAFNEMLRRMQNLKLPKSGSTVPLIAAMKNGNISKAKKEFEKLQEQMDSKELSKEEREKLQEQLQELAKQFEQLAKANDALASALTSAGLNGALAQNADAAMKAIKNAKNLSEAQKKKLLELIKAQSKANQKCKNLSKGCKQLANGKSESTTATELQKMQAMQQFMTKAELAKSACKKAGSCIGQGTGGTGIGNGGTNPVEKTDTTMVAQRTPVSTLEGTIIAKQLFEGGMLTTGESTSRVKETVLTQRREAEQAITDEEVPRRYHDLLRHYIGQLEELTEPSKNGDTENSE